MKIKQLNEYQEFAFSTLLEQCANTSYLTLGLCGESGEVAELIKKGIRDNNLDEKELAKELGDVLWYLSNLAELYGYTLEDIANINKNKLL